MSLVFSLPLTPPPPLFPLYEQSVRCLVWHSVKVRGLLHYLCGGLTHSGPRAKRNLNLSAMITRLSCAVPDPKQACWCCWQATPATLGLGSVGFMVLLLLLLWWLDVWHEAQCVRKPRASTHPALKCTTPLQGRPRQEIIIVFDVCSNFTCLWVLYRWLKLSTFFSPTAFQNFLSLWADTLTVRWEREREREREIPWK